MLGGRGPQREPTGEVCYQLRSTYPSLGPDARPIAHQQETEFATLDDLIAEVYAAGARWAAGRNRDEIHRFLERRSHARHHLTVVRIEKVEEVKLVKLVDHETRLTNP